MMKKLTKIDLALLEWVRRVTYRPGHRQGRWELSTMQLNLVRHRAWGR